MSIIRVSSKNRGKINRVYGTSNYIARAAPKKKYNEKDYYTRMINIAKEYVYAKNNKKYIKRIRVNGNRLSEKTLFKILKAYIDTLPVNKEFSKKSRVDYISNSLERNLKKHKVSPSTIQKILKYDSHYREKVVKKNSSDEKKIKRQVKSKFETKKISQSKNSQNKENAIRREKTRVSQPNSKHQARASHIKGSNLSKVSNKMSDYESYILKIIQFSYKNSTKDEIEAFIQNLNNRRKILSATLIQNIISAYKEILDINTNINQRKRLINDKLEYTLLQKGMHPDLVKIILQLDARYKN